MTEIKSYTVSITGIVQGVGMRPHIYKLAKNYGLQGCVCNQGTAVTMEISGDKKGIKEFLISLIKNPPVGAEIYNVKIIPKLYKPYTNFSIISSSSDDQFQGIIPPDTAICKDCMLEMQDKLNRRHLYPFTTCASCGPRFSIINKLPYDRINTTMSVFQMCPACRNEYENPNNRRFHSQTNCCPDCGPKLKLVNNCGLVVDTVNPIETARKMLLDGKIIGIKGIGGYHIACNALYEKSIDLLRKRKKRQDKPLAIMAANINDVKSICNVGKKEEEILIGSKRPIVLLEKKLPELLPNNIAHGINRIGVMLPYTALHYLLLQEDIRYLVMTSGNVSGMPICYKDEVAFEKLKDIVDYYLINDREIVCPIDDSVVRVIDNNEMVSRSGRGYSSFAIQIESKSEVIAVGSEQKSAICLLHNGYAHLTQYLGNLEDMEVYKEYLKAINRTTTLFDSKPKVVAYDLHKEYTSTKFALSYPGEKIPVQHHHAHMASSIAEHNITNDTIGIIYDGTGMGLDGAIWGGELFIGSKGEFTRVGHLKYVTIQGGDSAIKQPFKSVVSYLYSMGINSADYLSNVGQLTIETIQNAIRQNLNCFKTSSMGRLFDCVAALVLKRIYITYDAQAAIELESIIDTGIEAFYEYSIVEKDGMIEIGYEEILLGVLDDIKAGRKDSYIAAKFHNTICEATTDAVCRIRDKYGINDIVLSGGVFENAYLLKNIVEKLNENHFNTYHNMRVAINDGGIALGQIEVAVSKIKEGNYVSCDTSKDYI